MWKEILETKVIRAEGFNYTDLITEVFVTNKPIEELHPYNLDKAFELPMRSTCRLLIKSLRFNEFFSVSFNTRIFEEDGVHWLPLFKPNELDLLECMAEEVNSPRVLVLMNKKTSLDVIKEGGEKSEIGSACDEDYMPEIKLCNSFVESRLESLMDDEVDESRTQEVTETNDGAGNRVEIAQEINTELKAYVEKLNTLIEVEKNSKEAMRKEMEAMKNAFLAELTEAKKRETEIIEEYKKAESSKAAAKSELVRVKHEFKSLQDENARILKDALFNETSSANKIEELMKRVAVYEESYSESGSILSKISELSGQPSQNLARKLQEKEEIIKKLSREITELRLKVPAVKPTTILGDELEEAVKSYSKTHKLPYQLTRDKEQVYLFNTKKISLLLKDGQLLGRVGGVFKPLDECISALQQPEILITQKSLKISPELSKDSERSRIRASPTRKSNKSMTLHSKSLHRSSYN